MNNNIVSSEDIIAIAIVIFLAFAIFRSVRKIEKPIKETNSIKTALKYICSGCSKNIRHSKRTLSAQKRDTTHFFCNACHQKWIKTRPPVNDNRQEMYTLNPFTNANISQESTTTKMTHNNIQHEFSAHGTIGTQKSRHEDTFENKPLAKSRTRPSKIAQHIGWGITLVLVIIVGILLT